MKILTLIILAFSLNACVPDISGDTINYNVEGSYVAEGAYYIEQTADGIITSCIVSDSNQTCSDAELKEVEELVE